ncbi:MAG: hypothetical protein ACRDI2_18945 [Chloroflexota bacterium]
MVIQFAPEVRDPLAREGWRILEAPAGVTLAGLRAADAPFKGSKYFDQQATATVELPVAGGDVAYRPGLLPESLNQPYDRAQELVDGFSTLLPPGAVAAIGPAALYAWLLTEHHRRYGEWLLRQCYTWAADRSGGTHLAVGVFGRERPLLVSPLPEGTGRGVGIMPLVVPSS